MGYFKEDQILLYEELCGKPIKENEISKATIRFRENLKLVFYVTKRYSEPIDAAIDKEDILQTAYVALWEACLRFDESKGYEFSTYAVPIINGKILIMLRDNESLKTPRVFKDIRSALRIHGFTLPLSDEEMNILVEEKKFSRSQIVEYSQFSTISLDSYITDTDNCNLSDIIPDKDAGKFYKELSEEEIERLVNSVLSYIKVNNRDLVEEWLYASLEGYRITQSELAHKYKCSQAQVSRILKSAISIIDMNKEEIQKLFGI